jgi:RNA polymerase sigma factor (TIGR02999 family)
VVLHRGGALSTDADGRHGKLNKLLPKVYDELHALAEQHMRRERPDHTLQPTAIVHEVYRRLKEDGSRDWQTRSQFFAAAAESIRRILIDHARRHMAAKRGGDRRRCPLDDAIGITDGDVIDLIELDAALCELAAFDERMARVVELRFFGGLTVQEVAEILGMSKRTIENDWMLARAWLRRALAVE